MFVRWQSRNRKGLRVLLRAVLVESERVSGAPRQQHIAYLGSVADTKSALTGVTSGSAPSSGSTSSAAGSPRRTGGRSRS
jgi:hypothetical protein